MIFDTRISGIPCSCEVTQYQPAVMMMVTGMGRGDALPPEPEEFDYRILDTKGRHAPWLERKLTSTDTDRLKAEYEHQQRLEEYNAFGTY